MSPRGGVMELAGCSGRGGHKARTAERESEDERVRGGRQDRECACHVCLVCVRVGWSGVCVCLEDAVTRRLQLRDSAGETRGGQLVPLLHVQSGFWGDGAVGAQLRISSEAKTVHGRADKVSCKSRGV